MLDIFLSKELRSRSEKATWLWKGYVKSASSLRGYRGIGLRSHVATINLSYIRFIIKGLWGNLLGIIYRLFYSLG